MEDGVDAVRGRMSGLVGPDVRPPNPTMNLRNSILVAEIDDFGGKIAEISWMEDGETWGNARST